MTPAPRDMPKGTRVWTCDGCGKRETWRKGWRWWCGVESWNAANRFDATRRWPAVACSDACEDVVLKKVGPTRPRKGMWRMDLRDELLAIWTKYESQREAELNAVSTREQADKDLRELNEKRMRAGLPYVAEHREQSIPQWSGQHLILTAAPKTWRDEMDAELLACVRKHFTT